MQATPPTNTDLAVQVESLTQGVVGAGFQCEAMFAVRFLEFARCPVHGDHADLFLRPFLNRFVRQLDRHVPGTLHHHRPGHLVAVGVDREVR